MEDTKKDLDWAKDGDGGRLHNLGRRKKKVSEKRKWAREKMAQKG